MQTQNFEMEMAFLMDRIHQLDNPIISITPVLVSNFNINWSPKNRQLDRKANQFCSKGVQCPHRNCFFGHSLNDMQDNIKQSIQEKTRVANFLRGNPIVWDTKYLVVIQKIVHHECRNTSCRFNSLTCHYGLHNDNFVPKFVEGNVRSVELYNRICQEINQQLEKVEQQKQQLMEEYDRVKRISELYDPMVYPPLFEKEITNPIYIIGFRNAIDRGMIFYESHMNQKKKFKDVLNELSLKFKNLKSKPIEKVKKPLKISEKQVIIIQKLIRGFIVRRPLSFKTINNDGWMEKVPHGGIYAILKFKRDEDKFTKQLLNHQEKKMKHKKKEMKKIMMLLSEDGIRVPSVLPSETPEMKQPKKNKVIEKEVEEDEMALGEVDIFEGQDEELEKSQWKLRVTFEQKGKKKWNTIVELSDNVKAKQYTIRLKQEFRSPVRAIESNHSTWIIPGDQRSFSWRERLMEIFDVDKDQIKSCVISFE